MGTAARHGKNDGETSPTACKHPNDAAFCALGATSQQVVHGLTLVIVVVATQHDLQDPAREPSPECQKPLAKAEGMGRQSLPDLTRVKSSKKERGISRS